MAWSRVPGPTYYGYRDSGLTPRDATDGVVAAPFRGESRSGSYAMMPERDSYCAQRYRSYDPQSGTFIGRDGRRRPCR